MIFQRVSGTHVDLCLEALGAGRWRGLVGKACVGRCRVCMHSEFCLHQRTVAWLWVLVGTWGEGPHHSWPLLFQFFLCTHAVDPNTARPWWQLLRVERLLVEGWPADWRGLEAGTTVRHGQEPSLATSALHWTPLDFVVGGMPALL